MKDWAWLATAVGALGIATTFAAGLLGRRSERDAAHAAWLRERRLEAYAEFAKTGHALWQKVVEVWRGTLAPGHDAAIAMDEIRHELGRQQAQISILGTVEVASTVSALTMAYEQLVLMVNDSALLKERQSEFGRFIRQSPEGAAVEEAGGVFVNTARGVLT